jgi:tetratricopeptide (TPR) repeat protein/tRNA A-37 threonylcarbamoyl transferase component Bud32
MAEPVDARIAELMDAYLSGRVDRERLLEENPELADELRQALAALDFIGSADVAVDEPVRTLGDFEIQRELGRGGMGVVYEAEQTSLDRRVALKVLPFAAVMDPRQLQRFKNEAQAAAHLHHTHIVPVFSIGCERGVHYYAMQYIEGPTVAEMIEQLKSTAGKDMRVSSASALKSITKGRSTQSEAYCRGVARLGIQAAEALDHAHQQGVIHRDIKPANLIVDAGGDLWITDFGLASFTSHPGLTMTGDIVGTVRYMSPEQALAKRVPVDHRTDIYSLGVTLYEFVTLEGAYQGDDPHKVIQEIAFKDPRSARSLNPAVPNELETILMKAMAKSPEERYETAQELADDLERFLQNKPIEAKRPGLVKRAGKWARRHRSFVGAAVAVLVIAVIALVLSGAHALRKEKETEAQRKRAEENLALALEALNEIYIARADAHAGVTLKQGLSLELLKNGLRFYEAFARRNSGDENVRYWTGWANFSASLVHRKLGNRTAAKESMEAAINSFREATRLKPDHMFAHYNLGLALYEIGKNDEAAVAFREAIRLQPHPYSHHNLGAVLFRLGKHDEAIAAYREAIRLEPDSGMAHSNLGSALFAMGKHDEALVAYRKAIRVKPDYGAAHFNLGNALRRRGQLDDAIAAYREAIRLDPARSSAHNNLGTALRDKGQLDDAISAYREAIRLDPESVLAYTNLRAALLVKGEHDKAIAAFREAIQLDPGLARAPAHDGVGTALRARGEIDAAISAHREAIRLQPDYWMAHANLGTALCDKGEFGGAVVAFREAIRLKPNLAAVHYGLGGALRGKGEIDGAIAAYREAIRLQPDSWKAHNNLGTTLCDKGEFDGAIVACREAIRLEPDSGGSHTNLGRALCLKGQLDEGISALREGIRLQPDHWEGHNSLAWIFATCPDARYVDAEQAVELAKTAVELSHGSFVCVNTLGVAQYRVGDWMAAVKTIEKSIALRSGGDPNDWLFLAMACWQLDRKEVAREWFRKSVAWMEQNPSTEELLRFHAEAAELIKLTD